MLHEWCDNSYWGVLTLHLGGSWINPAARFVLYGWTEPFNLIHFKTAVDLGDVNGDGVDDLAVGANGGPEQAGYRGKAAVLRGDTTLRVGAEEPLAPLPQSLEVMAYPNPFNSSTTIEMNLPSYARDAELKVFNLLGQEIFDTQVTSASGRAVYYYDARQLSTGLYLLRVSAGDFQTTTKLMVLK